MASSPNYAASPSNGALAQISTANTARDGTGTLGTVFMAGASGGRIDKLLIQATGTTTAGMVRLFLDNGVGAIRMVKEVPVLAITPSATIPAWQAEVTFDIGLELQANAILKASTHNAESFNVIPTSAGNY